MPSRQLHAAGAVSHRHRLLLPLVGVLTSLFLLLLFLVVVILIYLRRRRLVHASRNRTAPASLPSPPAPLPLRFSFADLRLATSDFSPSLKLGQGGFGPVFRGSLPENPHIAVKLMDSSSLQGDLEFRNEISLASALLPLPDPSPPILLALGFCSDDDRADHPRKRRKRRKRRRWRVKKHRKSPNWFDALDQADAVAVASDFEDPDDDDVRGEGVFRKKRLLLVYDLMRNGSLQDALLVRKSAELLDWDRRYRIAMDVARGLRFLHVDCVPPIVHGDVKPSNVLLDENFRGRIADFGLARVLEPGGGEMVEIGTDRRVEEEGSAGLEAEESPELSPMRLEAMSACEVGGFDRLSVESGGGGGEKGWKNGSESGKDWWWKQDGGERKMEGGAGVKDYVMEWIGSEIGKERQANVWEAETSSVTNGVEQIPSIGKKKQQKSLDWWAFGDFEHRKKKSKPRRPREWWREEFCEELSRKSKKKQAVIVPKSNFCTIRSVIGSDVQWWRGQGESVALPCSKKYRKRSFSRGSSSTQHISELRVPPRHSGNDWHSGDIPKSGGLSSTPSMRGTVCYSAPECGGGASSDLSEKCDIYSFGVLLLVIVSGRRPLQVTASPISEFERANLISWARNLAHRDNLLDLVDPSLQGVDKEQALLCITVALLCLQRSPARRPNIEEVVGMLSGELEKPQLPLEFSPSPPCALPFKSRRKGR